MLDRLIRQPLPGSVLMHNPSLPLLVRMAMRHDDHAISGSGALVAWSGKKTGRSPKDKRIVRDAATDETVDWGAVNVPCTPEEFAADRAAAEGFIRRQPEIYIVDGFAGWEAAHRLKVRVVCTRPYHAQFMTNMLIRPTYDELLAFGDPDWTILNAGQLDHDENGTPRTRISLNFTSRELVIRGTQYAGEMKKGVFSILQHLLPARGVLPMHCSANEGAEGDVALFFGLSGTGKTTLSADPKRRLIGDDEHGWSEHGVFNFEGGCYAKTAHLSREREPEIFEAIRFGALLENVGLDAVTGAVDYADLRLTENTRCSYPIEHIRNAKIPCAGGHPRHVIFLTCDAFGVLPPVSRLTPEQAMYHFLSGYTAKVAGTEMGVKEPTATFSACFGAAFLTRPPTVYAHLLAEKLARHQAQAWLVNTGWTGGGPGVGSRISLPHTRAILDAVLAGHLDDAPAEADPVFGLAAPRAVPGVPAALLRPEACWSDPAAFRAARDRLAGLFRENFAHYAGAEAAAIARAGPAALKAGPA
jgi:phosphoenolpyruvate carboxykinase (ATP)